MNLSSGSGSSGQISVGSGNRIINPRADHSTEIIGFTEHKAMTRVWPHSAMTNQCPALEPALSIGSLSSVPEGVDPPAIRNELLETLNETRKREGGISKLPRPDRICDQADLSWRPLNETGIRCLGLHLAWQGAIKKELSKRYWTGIHAPDFCLPCACLLIIGTGSLVSPASPPWASHLAGCFAEPKSAPCGRICGGGASSPAPTPTCEPGALPGLS